MNDYKRLYYLLFNRISDTIAELELAQQEAEELFVLKEEAEQLLAENQDNNE